MRECCKRIYRVLAGLLPHAVIILSLLLLTLFVTDRFNRAMAFLNNDISYVLIWVFASLCVWQSAEGLLGKYPLGVRLGTILPLLASLALFWGRAIDRICRSHGFYNREASKWVLFGVCVLMVGHAILMIAVQRRQVRQELSKEHEEKA